MKILFIVHNYWPTSFAGVENYTHHISHEFAKRHKVFIITTEQNSPLVMSEKEKEGYTEKFKDGPVTIYKIHRDYSKVSRFEETYINYQMDEIVFNLTKKINPDIIHIQHLLYLSVTTISKLKKLNIPIIITLHDYWFQCPTVRRFRNKQRCNCSYTSPGIECIHESIPVPMIQNKTGRILSLIKKILQKSVLNEMASPKKQESVIHFTQCKGNKVNIRNKIFLENFNKADFIISPSEFLQNEAIKYGFDKQKCILVRHGTPYTKSNPKPIKIEEKKPLIFGFISSLLYEKGFFMVVNVFTDLVKKYSNFELRLYGARINDQETISVLKKIKEYKNINDFGIYHPDKRFQIIKQFNVLLNPSLWDETYGLTIDEAYVYKIPVIGTYMGAIPERVFHKKNGFLFDINKPNDFKRYVEDILSDPKILERFSRNIKQPLTIEEHCKQLEEIYKKCISK